MSEFDTPKPLASWALIVAVLIGGTFYLVGKNIESADRTPATINVSGEGKVTATPDTATLTFGVQTGRRMSSKEAMASLTQDMTNVIAAVKKKGVDDKDITTGQLSLNPAYDWTNGQQILRGYEAVQSLVVKVRAVDKTSDVLGAATNAGANQVGDVSFGIDKPDALLAQARQKAIADAQDKAQVLAKELGMKLGKLKGFNEGGANVPQPVPMFAKAMSADSVGSGAPPLPSGQQDEIVDVTLTYELR